MSNLYVSVHLQKGLPGAHRILTAIEVALSIPRSVRLVSRSAALTPAGEARRVSHAFATISTAFYF